MACGGSMFSKDYWYIGFLTLLILAMQVFAVLFLVKRKWASRIVLWILAAYVLAIQIADMAKGQFNIAFSTMAFWLFVLGVAVPWRPLKAVSAFFSMLAGGMYVSGFLLRPELLTHMGPFGINYMSGFLTHDILVVGSMLMLGRFEIKKYDIGIVGGVVAVTVAFTELSKYVFHLGGVNDFLVGMIEGTVLKNELFPNLPLTWWWYVLWYIILLALLWGVWELICFINRRLLRYGNFVPDKLLW